jgi:hypothetical protein
MIGKTVMYYDSNNELKKGVVLDKYTGSLEKHAELPSGKGGTVYCKMPVSVDWYILKVGDGIYHLECSSVVQVIEV